MNGGRNRTDQKDRKDQKDQKSQNDILQYKDELADLKKLTMDRLVDIADSVGKAAVESKVKMNQIRRFLDGARKVEAELKSREDFEKIKEQIVLLRPKLAYAAGRHEEVKDVARILDAAVRSAAQNEDNFMKFLRLMESIIAYHRFHGGKD